MFPHRLQTTAFTEPAVDRAFKISGDSPFDAVMLSVLRAILPLHTDDPLRVSYDEQSSSYDTFNSAREVAIVNTLFRNGLDYYQNTLRIISFSSCSEIPKSVTSAIEKNENWGKISRVSQFFDSVVKTVCYICPERKSTIILTCKLDTAKVHYLCCALFAFFPWYFGDKKVSQDEKDLLQSLRNNTPDRFLSVLQRFESKYDFYTLKLDGLERFETSWMDAEVNELSDKVQRIEDSIRSLMNDISTKLQQKEDYCIRINGIRVAQQSDSTDSIKDYLLDNKDRIHLVEIGDNDMKVEVISDLVYFDSDFAESLYKNKRSVLFTERGSEPRLKSVDMGRLFKAIFIDNTVTLQMCAAYRLNVREMSVSALGSFNYGAECVNCIPNTHIDYHRCLGGYSSALITAMKNHNYVAALEQCVLSCQSLNLLEEPTLRPFIKSLYQTNKKCIRFNDGTLMTPAEAANALLEKKEVNEDEQTD